MTAYTCRAECQRDIDDCIAAMNAAGVPFKTIAITPDFLMGEGVPDRNWKFETSLTRPQIAAIWQTVDDTHVMCQTLTHSEHFTGDRTYSDDYNTDEDAENFRNRDFETDEEKEKRLEKSWAMEGYALAKPTLAAK